MESRRFTNLRELFFSAVDLSSCSEDEYDSDDSERDLRLVEVDFCVRFCILLLACSCVAITLRSTRDDHIRARTVLS